MSLNVYRMAFDTHLDQHEKWQALFDIQNEVSPEVFWALFRDTMESTSALHNNAEIIRRMLTEERINSTARLWAMSDDDREWFKRTIRRAQKFKIYRGAGNPNRTGFMWTTDIMRAAQYAYISGFEKPEIVVGWIKPSKVVILDKADSDVFVFPEDVEITETRPLAEVPKEAELLELRLRIMVATYGAHHPLQLTKAAYIAKAVNELRINKDTTVAFMQGSREFLEPLGFKSRVATIDSILEALDVRSA